MLRLAAPGTGISSAGSGTTTYAASYAEKRSRGCQILGCKTKCGCRIIRTSSKSIRRDRSDSLSPFNFHRRFAAVHRRLHDAVMTHNAPEPGRTQPAELYQVHCFPVLVLREGLGFGFCQFDVGLWGLHG